MSARRPRVVVLHGAVAADAPPDEQDVLVEARAVAAALRRLGYDARPMALGLDLAAARRRLERLRPALVFNLVEAVEGSGRLIHLAPSLLEALGLAYTGAPLAGLFLSSNKLVAKRLLAVHGIATPAWCLPTHAGTVRGEEGGLPGPGPWIVKSVWEHASIGMDDRSVVPETGALPARLAERRTALGGAWFAEAYIAGREFNVAVLGAPDGPQVLPLAEMTFEGFPPDKPRIVGYRAKWEDAAFEYAHTVRRFRPAEQPLSGTLEALARRCWALFGLRGAARVDFRVDGAGRPWVLEVNANPGLAPDAGLVAAAAQADLDYDALIARIVGDTADPDALG